MPKLPLDVKDHELDMFGQVICNTSADELSISCWGASFSLPPHSTFLLADVTRIGLLTSYAGAECEREVGLPTLNVGGG